MRRCFHCSREETGETSTFRQCLWVVSRVVKGRVTRQGQGLLCASCQVSLSAYFLPEKQEEVTQNGFFKEAN